MERMQKSISKKTTYSSKVKNRHNNFRAKPSEKRYTLQHFLHPDYILFDWEFYSRELEFE